MFNNSNTQQQDQQSAIYNKLVAKTNDTVDAAKQQSDKIINKLQRKEQNEATITGSITRALYSVRNIFNASRLLEGIFASPLKAFKPVRLSPLQSLKYTDSKGDTTATLQDNNNNNNNNNDKSKSVQQRVTKHKQQAQQLYDTAKNIHDIQGKQGLARHIVPPLVFNVLVGSILFSTYQRCIEYQQYIVERQPNHPLVKYIGVKWDNSSYFDWLYKQYDYDSNNNEYKQNQLHLTGIVISGLVAGFAQSLLATPMDRINTVIQYNISNQHNLQHNDMVSIAQSIYKQSGIRGLYNNYSLTLLRDSISIATFFSTFEIVKAYSQYTLNNNKSISSQYQPQHNKLTAASIVVGSGFISGTVYKIISQPFYNLQYMQYVYAKENTTPISIYQLIKYNGGFRSLYHNMSVRLLSILNPAVIGLFAFELTKDKQQRKHHTLAVHGS